MKTLQEGDRGCREMAFYRKIFVEHHHADQDRDAVLFLRDYIPRYHGIVQVLGGSHLSAWVFSGFDCVIFNRVKLKEDDAV